MIIGGWNYVWAAYAVAWSGLAFYSLLLVRRYRAELQSEQARKAQRAANKDEQ